ncbi:fat storage-inducing transmembrane protein 2 [Irineochytrium annulatum]|nr:fat storage-inducing transmembrane protein 2 [Irineochytrium annulatum]
MSLNRTQLALLYVGTVLAGTLVDLPESFFSNKYNVLNQFFAKYAWGWTSGLLLIFIPLASFDRARHRGAHASPQAYITRGYTRWAVAFLYWFVLTQWMFGPSLMERIFHATGECTDGKFRTLQDCKKGGAKWEGVDISGHCMLLIHASLLIWEELRILSFVPEAMRSDPTRYLNSALQALIALWWVMLVSTAIYFHSTLEKLLGTALGLACWAGTNYVWPGLAVRERVVQ